MRTRNTYRKERGIIAFIVIVIVLITFLVLFLISDLDRETARTKSPTGSPGGPSGAAQDARQRNPVVDNRPAVTATTSPIAGAFRDGDRVTVRVPCGCTPNPSDFSLMATALVNQDQAALASLANQGKVLLLDSGTRGWVVASGLSGSRTNIRIESGEHIGKNCDLLTAQLEPKRRDRGNYRDSGLGRR